MVWRLLFAGVFVTTSALAADEPKWLGDAHAREGKITESRTIKSKDGWLEAKVPAKLVGTIEKVDGSYGIELDVGGDASVHCEVVPESIDMAATIQTTLDTAVKHIEETQGKIAIRDLLHVDAGVLDDVPFLKAAWLYGVNDGKDTHFGTIKQFVLEKNGYGVYCTHVALGYTRTFANVARAFAATLETRTRAPAPYYKEISVVSLTERNLGIAVTTLTRGVDGATEAREGSAMLVPVGGGKVKAHDSMHKFWLDADGSLRNAVHVISEDGAVTTNIRLEPADQGWVVAGEFQGKNVSQPLETTVKPGSWVQQALEVRKILAGEKPVGATHTIALWSEMNPGKLIEAKTQIVSKIDAEHYAATLELAQMRMDATLDTTGVPSAGTIKAGPASIQIKRVYRSGGF